MYKCLNTKEVLLKAEKLNGILTEIKKRISKGNQEMADKDDHYINECLKSFKKGYHCMIIRAHSLCYQIQDSGTFST